MRHLAIGDIHGCFHALTTLADYVPFLPDDHLILMGDYVDRGPQSKDVVEWLIERDNVYGLTALRGNHEVMMLQAREDNLAKQSWLTIGGYSTLMSYGDNGDLARIPDSHWTFLEGTKRFYETESHIFVHGNIDPQLPLQEQTELIFWMTFGNREPHISGKKLVCGHTTQRSGRPRDIGHAVCIDTYVYGDGWLTCLDVQSGQYWQANEKGETRTGHLNELAAD